MSTAIGVEKTAGPRDEVQLLTVPCGLGSPVFVIFTSIQRTLHALERARQLAEPLHEAIEILVVQTVPFLLPLDDASVPFEFLVKSLEEAVARFSDRIKISAYLCRDVLQALKQVLDRNSPVVMGVRKRGWPTRDRRIARKLKRLGFNVILDETE